MTLKMRSIWGNYFIQNGSERLVALFIHEFYRTVCGQEVNPPIKNISEFTGLTEAMVKKCLISLFNEGFLVLSRVMTDEKDNKYVRINDV